MSATATALNLKPTRGEAIEVIVAWKGRILSSFGFLPNSGSVFIGGGSDADVMVPTLSSESKYELLRAGVQTRLMLAPGMKVEIISEQRKISLNTLSGEFYMRQDEMAYVELQGGLISLHIRHVPRSPQALAPVFFDFGSSESGGVALALATSAILGTFMNYFTPRQLSEKPVVIEKHLARMLFKPPQPAVIADVPKPQIAIPVRAASASNATSKPKPRPKAKPGGLLETFGKRGLVEQMNRIFSEGNDLARTVGAGTGGKIQDGGAGGVLKETGSGGGAQTVRVGGITKTGRNVGEGYSHVGGNKGSNKIIIDGQEEGFTAGMDREAIRRVIREHLAEVRTCYERELQHAPELYGKLVLEWDIEDRGQVRQAIVKSNSLGNSQVAECLIGRLKSWKFPDPPANLVGRVSYPFIFSSH